MTWERWAAASGLAALVFAGAAVAFERSTPNPHPSAADVVDFYVTNRSALLVQSLLFVLSAGLFLWFLAGLRAHLARAEGHTDRVSSIVYAAGIGWLTVNMAVQAPQIALAQAAADGLEPRVTVVVNNLGLALATIADVPVAVMVAGVGVLSLRALVFPAWLGWLSMAVAALHVVAWFGVLADSGPLAPGGWVTFVVYPAFVVWLVAVIVAMLRPARPATHVPRTG